jgi:hypothetical protein
MEEGSTKLPPGIQKIWYLSRWKRQMEEGGRKEITNKRDKLQVINPVCKLVTECLSKNLNNYPVGRLTNFAQPYYVLAELCT